MCDYSLHHIGSRPAQVNDRIVTTELTKASAIGFAAVGEEGVKLVIHDAPPKVAVCLMPGTELSFDDDVRYGRPFNLPGSARAKHRLARFRQVDLDDPHVQHDALEFPDGQIVKIGRLCAGQTARVLQLPATTAHAEHHHDHAGAGRAGRPSESRLALNRVASGPGIASLLMPSQNTVMLWRTCRSAALSLSTALEQSLRRRKAHARPTLDAADAVRTAAPFVEKTAVDARSAGRRNAIRTTA